MSSADYEILIKKIGHRISNTRFRVATLIQERTLLSLYKAISWIVDSFDLSIFI